MAEILLLDPQPRFAGLGIQEEEEEVPPTLGLPPTPLVPICVPPTIGIPTLPIQRELIDEQSIGFFGANDDNDDKTTVVLLDRIKRSYTHQFQEEQNDVLALFFNAAKYQVYHYFFGSSSKAPPPPPSAHRLRIDHYTAGLHLRKQMQMFQTRLSEIAQRFVDLVKSKLGAAVQHDTRHPLYWFVEQVIHHREFHIRRAKTDPSLIRTKVGPEQVLTKLRNAVTGDVASFKPTDSEVRYVILHPLASDADFEEKDYKEGGLGELTQHVMSKLQRDSSVATLPPPYGIVVSDTWCTLLQCLSNIVHFIDYLHVTVLGCVLEAFDSATLASMKKQTWSVVWTAIASPEYAGEPVEGMPRATNRGPRIVSELAVMRDLLRTVTEILETHSQ